MKTISKMKNTLCDINSGIAISKQKINELESIVIEYPQLNTEEKTENN